MTNAGDGSLHQDLLRRKASGFARCTRNADRESLHHANDDRDRGLILLTAINIPITPRCKCLQLASVTTVQANNSKRRAAERGKAPNRHTIAVQGQLHSLNNEADLFLDHLNRD